MAKKTAVVILNWNGKNLLQKFLPALIQYTTLPEVELVVADNGSTDDSISFLKQNYPTVKIIPLNKNWGFADGYNQALQKIEAEYFVLLNSDVEVSPNWLEPLIETLDTNNEVSAVQPKICAQKQKNSFEYAGACGGFIDRYGYPFCRGRIFGVVELDDGQYNEPIEIFWASGACLMIRSKDYFEAGGLDASFFAHMEEIDLCWRLNSRGKKLMCNPVSTIYHVGGGTLNQENPHKTFLNFRNNLLMLYKNLNNQKFNKVYRIRFFLDMLAFISFLSKLKFKNAVAIIRAHRQFHRVKKTYNKLREENMRATVVKQIPTILDQSIVIDFFWKKKKYFSEIDFGDKNAIL